VPKTDTTYIVKTSSTTPSSSCWGTYRRVGVMEMTANAPPPTQLSERSRGCVQVVETWENLNVGKTGRCAYRRALAEAIELASACNDDGEPVRVF